MTFLFNWMICRFHVHFQGCSGFKGYRFSWGKVKQRSKEERTGRVLIQLKLGVRWREPRMVHVYCFWCASWEDSSWDLSSDFAFLTHDFHKRSLEEYHKLLLFSAHKQERIAGSFQLLISWVFSIFSRRSFVDWWSWNKSLPTPKKRSPFRNA